MHSNVKKIIDFNIYTFHFALKNNEFRSSSFITKCF